MSFPVSAAPYAFASSRVQMDCLKQSTCNVDNWSQRVLTVDRGSSTLTISRHHHPTDVFYHSLRPSEVQTWPHFSTEIFNDDFYSAEAKLTLCVLGTTAAVPDFTASQTGEEVALVGIPLPLSNVEAASLPETPYPPPDYTPAPPPGAHVSIPAAGLVTIAPTPTEKGRTRREKPGKFDVWVLRFASKTAYAVALHMLSQLPNVKFSRTQSRPGVHAGGKQPSFTAGRLGLLTIVPEPLKKTKSRSNAAH